jgi:rare lipoprotein A
MAKNISILIICTAAFFIAAFTTDPGAAKGDKTLIKGIASYYHNKFNGRKTASGEIFSNDSLTAAHKTLPLGTWVKVTNLKNDSSVILKINDRLPKTSTRTIDVTVAAARKLNFIREGLTKVVIEILQPVKLYATGVTGKKKS